MQAKLSDGTVMACGGCSKDGQVMQVGEKNSRKCSVGLAVGKRENGEAIWANVVAWHDLATILGTARKGTPVFVIGRMESREHNGKTYTDLVAEYVSVCSPAAAALQPNAPQAPAQAFHELAGDGELPF